MKKLILFLLAGIFFSGLSFVSAAGFIANTTTYWMHNESDSQFSRYYQLRNASTEFAMITSAALSTDNPVPAVRCWANNWTSPNFTSITSMNGIWNFSLNFTRNGTTTAYLFAKVFKLNSTGRFEIANSSRSTNVGGQTTNAAVVWGFNLTTNPLTNLSIGERVGVQFCLNITVRGSIPRTTNIYWENSTKSFVTIPLQYFDASPPKVNIIYPQNTTYNKNVSAINYTIVETNPSRCWYSNSSGVWNSTSVPAGTNWTNVTSTEGSNTWIVYANDSAGNLNFSSVTFFKDTIAPEINITSPQDGATYGYNVSLDLNYSVSDEHLDSCWYNFNNGSNISLINCQNISFNVSTDGNYVVYVYANDSLSNVGMKNVTFSVFVGAPTIILNSPIGIYLNSQNIALRYVPSDSDLDSCELWGNFTGVFSLNQTNITPASGLENLFKLNLPDGIYRWNVRCNDSLGHFAFNGNKIFYVDTVKPLINITQPIGTQSISTGIPLSFSAYDSSPLSCYYNLTTSSGTSVIGNTLINNCINTSFDVSSDGNYVVYMKVVDAAANYNFASSSFSVDTSTAVIPISSVPSGGGGGGGCLYCTEWSECNQQGKQTRICNIIGTCPSGDNPLKTEQNCTYFALEKALFDIALAVINPQVIFGKNLTARISLINFGNKTNLNVTVNYIIIDSNNNTILSEEEIVPVGLQNEFIKEFALPSQITPGEYKLFVEINYEGQEKEAASQVSFEILSEKQGIFSSLTGKAILTGFGKISYWIIGILLLLIIIIVVYILVKFNYINKIREKIRLRDEAKIKEKIKTMLI